MDTVSHGCDLLERLHEGASTEVYRGRRRLDGLPVVLKIVKGDPPPPAWLVALRHEHAILRELEIDGVVRTHGLEEDRGRWALLLEDFGGKSLEDLGLRGKLPLDQLLSLAIALVDAVDGVHQRRVVHKHIIPANVLVNRDDGRVKLIDFGIATVLAQEVTAFGSTGLLEGTLAYISPEQTGRMNRSIDYRADYYSLGVVLYELLTGRLPFEAEDPLELVHSHLARQPRPPDELDGKIPRALAGVVLRLMAKTAGDRYQSARGIHADLLGCLDQLRRTGAIDDFPTGRQDLSPRFRLPQQLYGRSDEIRQVLAAFEEAGAGALFLSVSGSSGVGKSALIREVYRPLTRRRGYFVSGKFDQGGDAAPYSALSQALDGLVEQVMTEREDRVVEIRRRILEVTQPSAQILLDLCPAIEKILGPQPGPPSLPAAETSNRLRRIVLEFLAIFAEPEHPLALFLDDLQWADVDSLKLLQELMHSGNELTMLLIGAHRDNEVGEGHPLALTLRTLEADGARIKRLSLSPLRSPDVRALVADTLSIDPREAEPLAELLLTSTGGNPFFVHAFLRSLHTDGLLEHTPQGWRWDLDRIRRQGVTENVVDLMVAGVTRLPRACQDALQSAACLSGPFDMETLGIVAGLAPEVVARDLWDAVLEGLVLSLDTAHSSIELAALSGVRCRFAHDRIQQAVLSMIDANERPRLHLAVGRRLRRGARPGDRARWLFEVVRHLNLGRAALHDAQELDELARLNLEAAQRLLKLAANERALDCARAGLRLLDDEDWERRYALARDLTTTAAEAAFLGGDFDTFTALSTVAMRHARSVLDEVKIRELEGQLHYTQQRLPAALATYLDVLERLGFPLPRAATPADIGLELAAAAAALGDCSVEDLVDLPACTDASARAALEILYHLIGIVTTTASQLFPVVICRMVQLSQRHGSVPEMTSGYIFYGMLLLQGGDVDRACRFAKMAINLVHRFGRREFFSQSYLMAHAFVLHHKVSLPELSAPLRDAYRYGMEAASPFSAANAATTMCINRLLSGDPLGEVAEDIARYADVLGTLRQGLVLNWHRIYQQTVVNLREQTPEPGKLGGAFYDETRQIPVQIASGDVSAMFNYHFCKTLLCYVFGDFAGAAASAEANTPFFTAASTSLWAAAWFFLECLSRLSVYEGSTEAERARILDAVAVRVATLEGWLHHCPRTHEHKLVLIQAERARVLGRFDQAEAGFLRGIELAELSGYAHELAIARELTGRFNLARGNPKAARQHLRDAHQSYLRWGAIGKAGAMERQYPKLVPRVIADGLSGSTLAEAARSELDFNALDLISVLNASQELSREIALDRVLARLMELLIETSGAESGYLLLERGGQWLVEAEKTVDREARVLQSIPMEDLVAATGRGLPVAVVYYVARTQESLVLDDAASHDRFGRDPLIARYRVKSILCFPLGRHAGRRGVAYLENNLVEGAFTPTRIRILQMLCTQAVISLENAGLYDTLEQKVEARTAELQQKNEDLAGALQRLEETRDRLIVQDRLASLGSLAAGIAHELRNPLNFVTNFAEVSSGLVSEIDAELATLNGKIDMQSTSYLGEVLGDLKGNMKRISEHGARMDGIIRSMLEHSRGDEGEREEIDVNALVTDYVKLGYHGVKSRLPALEVTFDMDLDPTLSRLSLVPQQISRVIVNLIDNACYAVNVRKAALGARGFSPRIRITTKSRGSDVEIRVHDNGAGIPEKARGMIFNPFFTTKPPGEGTGLGLSIVHDIIVKGSGGSIRFETAEGEFTEFIVNLPRRRF